MKSQSRVDLRSQCTSDKPAYIAPIPRQVNMVDPRKLKTHKVDRRQPFNHPKLVTACLTHIKLTNDCDPSGSLTACWFVVAELMDVGECPNPP
jgi:hypothetical protein